MTILLRVPVIYNAIFNPAEPAYEFFADTVVCGVAWSVFLLGTLEGKGWMARAMTWMPLRYLGWVSFSAYLRHKKLIDELRDIPVPPALRLPILVIVLLAVSTVSYLLVERPFSRLRLSRK